ncbi:hypothetical protein [Halosolutus gelatinilyticus]|uniref:hypothetical protein n=1 Tax=Halosolutus gelatinilyticus TaxID=2931975 RepID=UPI001FF0EDF5|nr:hypothetical protein [Halosolutus gelatinilyticus]
MTDEYANEHEHDLEAEYLSASDATVLDIYYRDTSPTIDVVVPCPSCSDPLRVSARVDEVVETDMELPIDDSEGVYD